MKYIVITGGTVSGLGKGITISSIGKVLKSCGIRTTSIKIDPYLNVDAGTMSPFEHGEVFVLNDGGESDLDLGNYERFLDVNLTSEHNITTGKMYKSVIDKERRGDFLGKTVQVVPHITNEIMDWMERVAQIPVDETNQTAHVCLVEVGGTVGDIESMVFLEALRQFQFRVGRENICFVHLSLVPTLSNSDEQKTKPTQHGVKELRSLGLSPDLIVCRASSPLTDATREKIALFCHVKPTKVLSVHDVDNIYHVPLILRDQNLVQILFEQLQFPSFCGSEGQYPSPDLGAWEQMANSVDSFKSKVVVALVGKYTGLQDSYLSVLKALNHAAYAVKHNLELLYIDASELEKPDSDSWTQLRSAQGVLVPGGFGVRGVKGKILAITYARENKVPYLGICLGMQLMVVEYARNVLGRSGAHSTEFDSDTKHPTVVFMPEVDKENMGGTMRLGARSTMMKHFAEGGEKSLGKLLYGDKDIIMERHRHRYEVNPEVVDAVEEGGLKFVGRDETGMRMEVAELSRNVHPFYLGCQYHPEFISHPLNPSRPFLGFLLAATDQLNSWLHQGSQAHKKQKK